MMTLFKLLLISVQIFAAGSISFNDESLKSLLSSTKDNSKAIIYTWSPHMVLAQKGLSELLHLPQNKSFQVIVLLDPNANLELAQKMATDNGWPTSVLKINSSLTLVAKGMRVHYPSYLFVQNQKFVGHIVPGYKQPEHLNKIMQEYFR